MVPQAFLALLVAVLAPSALAVSSSELTFTMIAGANATGQWTLKMARGNKYWIPDGGFIPVNCNNGSLNACIATDPAIMQDVGDLLQLTFNLTKPRGPGGSLATYQGAQPTRILGKLCYSTNTSVNRAWRTQNKAYPRLSSNCPINIGEIPFTGGVSPLDTVDNSATITLDFDTQDEIPIATWFAMLWVYCGSSVCAYETTENINFVQTQVEMGITSGMRAAAIILSVFAPTLYITYGILDTWYYRRTGKGLRFDL